MLKDQKQDLKLVMLVQELILVFLLLPAITSGNGTTIVGDNTTQTLTNKTLLIDEDNLVITDGDEEAIFQINWTTTQDTRRSYFLPDAGTVTTTAEPTATSSTLLDTKTEQTVT